jgi:SAM-dependent methyltransferase
MQYRPPQLEPTSPVLAQLREIVKRSGYLTAGIAPTIETTDDEIIDAPPDSPLYTLLRFFFSREPVQPAALIEAVRPLSVQQIMDCGFCRLDGELIRSNVLLQPYDDLLFAVGQFSLEPRREEILMEISPSSMELANLMIPRPCRKTLDLGTGCGFLAALLSRSSEQVYAVDLNPTAVQFAKFNALWNGISNVKCLQGNLFEPVRDLKFDLIVSNPPFFVCPVPTSSVNSLLFQHSGIEDDSFCIQLAHDATGFLEEGGFFHMMFCWLERAGQGWKDKLTAAFSGMGCDAWCLRVSQDPAEHYIDVWCGDLGHMEHSEIEALRQQAYRNFRKNGITSVGMGLLTLRRCSTRPSLLWFDEAPEDRSEPYGSSVEAIFDVRARFDSVPDEIFLKQKFKAAPGVVSLQKASLQGNKWKPSGFEFGRESGLKYTFSGVNAFLAQVVSRLDGRRTLMQALEELSREQEVPLARVISGHLSSIRELLRYGFLLPASKR